MEFEERYFKVIIFFLATEFECFYLLKSSSVLKQIRLYFAFNMTDLSKIRVAYLWLNQIVCKKKQKKQTKKTDEHCKYKVTINLLCIITFFSRKLK